MSRTLPWERYDTCATCRAPAETACYGWSERLQQRITPQYPCKGRKVLPRPRVIRVAAAAGYVRVLERGMRPVAHERVSVEFELEP